MTKKLADIFNSYFCNITKYFNVPLRENNRSVPYKNTVYEAVVKYASHPSIMKIKTSFKSIDAFEFSNTSLEEIKCYIKDLDTKKKTSSNIPSSILKLTIDICAEYIKRSVNICIVKCKFPEELKCGEITPCHKGEEETAKKNYRPISILPCLSKIFERVLDDQINDFFQNIFFKHLGFASHGCFNTEFYIGFRLGEYYF